MNHYKCTPGAVKAPRYNKASACGSDSTQLVTVKIPLEKGGDGPNDPLAPKLGAWRNTVVVYEKTSSVYLYDVNGVYTNLTGTDYAAAILAMQDQIAAVTTTADNAATAVSTETTERKAADLALQNQITTNMNGLLTETVAREQAITDLTAQVNQASSAASGAASGIADETAAREAADTELQQAITAEATARETADTAIKGDVAANTQAITTLQQQAGQPVPGLDKTVQLDTAVVADAANVNIVKTLGELDSEQTTQTSLPLPVASESQAGIISAETFTTINSVTEQWGGKTLYINSFALPAIPKGSTGSTSFIPGFTKAQASNYAIICTPLINNSTWVQGQTITFALHWAEANDGELFISCPNNTTVDFAAGEVVANVLIISK